MSACLCSARRRRAERLGHHGDRGAVLTHAVVPMRLVEDTSLLVAPRLGPTLRRTVAVAEVEAEAEVDSGETVVRVVVVGVADHEVARVRQMAHRLRQAEETRRRASQQGGSDRHEREAHRVARKSKRHSGEGGWLIGFC